jgi:hypothetical protein
MALRWWQFLKQEMFQSELADVHDARKQFQRIWAQHQSQEIQQALDVKSPKNILIL